MLHPPNDKIVELKRKALEGAPRFGEPIDEQQVRLLLTLGHSENSIFGMNVGKAEYIMKRFLYSAFLPASDKGIRGCFGVIGPLGGKLEALTMASVSAQWYSDQPYLEEYIVYVHPEHRKAGHAAKLLDFLIGVADNMGVPLLTGILSQTRMEAKCRLYRRKVTPIGQFFLHLPKTMPQWESTRILSQFQLTPSSSAAA